MDFQRLQFDPKGAVYDTDPHDVPDEYWTESYNMRFKNRAVEKIGGDSEATTTTGQGTHLLFNGDHATPYWLYFGDGVARVTDFTTDKDIEGTALSSGTDWDTCLFNLFPICNNTVDQPRYWDKDFTTPGTLSTLTAFPSNTTCQVIRPFRSFLVAMNITDTGASPTAQPNRVLWSDSSDSGAIPASWDITDPATLAGDAYLTDDRGEIIGGWQLRDYFVIYKTHSTYIMRLIGGQSVMRIDKVQVNSGMLTKNCVTEFEGKHFVVADGDIVLFDGQNIQSIADKRVRSQIFDNIDSTNYGQTHVVRYDKLNEIWVCYPSSGQSNVDTAAIWNWLDDTWTFRKLNDTFYIASGVANTTSTTWAGLSGYTWANLSSNWQPYWNAPSANPTADSLHSIATLAINTIDDTYDFEGSPMVTRLEKRSMDLGEPEKVKYIDSVIPRITGTAGMTVYIRIGTQLNPDDTITWQTEQAYVVGTDREVHPDVKGRYISIRFRTEGTGENWKLHGFTIKGKPAGDY